MPIVYQIDHGSQHVQVTGTGVIHGSEMMELDEILRGDREFDPGFSQLIDFSQVEGRKVSPSPYMRDTAQSV